jgi:MHS family proline/betaine transporter-like MFS transporter
MKGTGKKNTIPLLHGLKSFKKEFLASFLLAGANNANFYFILIFLPGFLKTQYPNSPQFDTLTLTVIMLAMLPLIGWLSDRVGRLKILFVTSLCFVFYQYFLLSSLINASSAAFSYIHVIVSAIMIASFVSATNIFVLEIFPTSCRFSCGALSYSLGTALLGGTAPFVCSYITSNFGSNPNYLAYYISFLSFLGFLGVLLVCGFEQIKNIKWIFKNLLSTTPMNAKIDFYGNERDDNILTNN